MFARSDKLLIFEVGEKQAKNPPSVLVK